MATLFCAPLALSINGANAATTAPASNLSMFNYPGMVWRSANLATVYVTAQIAGTWDTLALVGTNLRASDTVRIRAASTAAATTSAPAYDTTIAAWTGVAPVGSALTLLTLPTARNETFDRIDITSTGNPAGYVEVQSLVIGQRFENPGLDIGAERTMEDMSGIEEGIGYTAINASGVRVGWKLTISGIKEADYEAVWHPFARKMGNSKPFLFVEDTAPAYLQNRAALCRFTSSAKGSASASDYYVIDASLKSVS